MEGEKIMENTQIGLLAAKAVTTVPEVVKELSNAWTKSRFDVMNIKKEISNEIISTCKDTVNKYIELLSAIENHNHDIVKGILDNSALTTEEKEQLLNCTYQAEQQSKDKTQKFVLGLAGIVTAGGIIISGMHEAGKAISKVASMKCKVEIAASGAKAISSFSLAALVKAIKH